ncbi:META domain-containing protein [Candidatus Kaiserbacteria bacterium]|nr:META domain-containing protein [Candidatus Kaiserbacteria bacterium]
MKYAVFGVVAAGCLLAGGYWVYATYLQQPAESLPTDYKDISFPIGETSVTLVDGVSDEPAMPGAASRIVIRYFGNEVRKDLDGDGREDVAFLVTQESGGSGTFFYVVAALDTGHGYRGVQAYYLGDRIAPQSTVSGPGRQVIVNYADRAPYESYTTPPSYGKSAYLVYDAGLAQFIEVPLDEAGAPDPARMTLTMKTWEWQRLQEEGAVIVPQRPGVFMVTFWPDGTFKATTDCNLISGTYAATADTIALVETARTERACPPSQEVVFAQALAESATYRFSDDGELSILLKGGGMMWLR